MNYRERIEKIAETYHLVASQPDMFIENTIQAYEAAWLSRLVPKESRLLELGVGDGITMKLLAPHFDYHVVEGSLQLVGAAREFSRDSELEIEVHHSWFEEFEPRSGYDAIYASHVLEHVEDPVSLLQKMRTWLNPGGKLIVIVPNSESLHRRLGVLLGLQPKLESLSKRDEMVGHLRVYSDASLTRDLEAGGFSPEIKRGFFVKPLSNFQLQHLSEKEILGLCQLSDEVPLELCANLAVVAVATNR